MSPCRRALATGLLAASLLVTTGAPAPAGAQAAPTQTAPHDIIAEAHDLILGVSSLDGSILQEESDGEVTVTLAADVLFVFDKADLTPEARTLVTEAARTVTEQATGTVRIDGYTDAKGETGYNLELSKRRAEAVHAALAEAVGTGVRFTVAGHGEADPVAANTNPDGSDNPEGRARNRRVTISFTH